MRKELESKSEELEVLSETIEQIRREDTVEENYDQFNDAKLRAAILEQEIDSLNRRLGAT